MSREISFRAWDNIDKVMVHWEAITSFEFNNDGNSFAREVFLGRYNCEIEQYTGLRDQNLERIFEGDIVIYKDRPSSACVVSFFEGAFIAGSALTSSALINFNTLKHIKVIGNIHQNKELLE